MAIIQQESTEFFSGKFCSLTMSVYIEKMSYVLVSAYLLVWIVYRV